MKIHDSIYTVKIYSIVHSHNIIWKQSRWGCHDRSWRPKYFPAVAISFSSQLDSLLAITEVAPTDPLRRYETILAHSQSPVQQARCISKLHTTRLNCSGSQLITNTHQCTLKVQFLDIFGSVFEPIPRFTLRTMLDYLHANIQYSHCCIFTICMRVKYANRMYLLRDSNVYKWLFCFGASSSSVYWVSRSINYICIIIVGGLWLLGR